MGRKSKYSWLNKLELNSKEKAYFRNLMIGMAYENPEILRKAANYIEVN